MSFDFFCSPNCLFWWVVYAPPSSPSLMIPLQKVEAQEREDVLAGMAGKAIKGKVGKPKVKKLQLEETMPSPYGRRVVPEITAMKADASKKLLKKRKVAHGSWVGSTSVMILQESWFYCYEIMLYFLFQIYRYLTVIGSYLFMKAVDPYIGWRHIQGPTYM